MMRPKPDDPSGFEVNKVREHQDRQDEMLAKRKRINQELREAPRVSLTPEQIAMGDAMDKITTDDLEAKRGLEGRPHTILLGPGGEAQPKTSFTEIQERGVPKRKMTVYLPETMVTGMQGYGRYRESIGRGEMGPSACLQYAYELLINTMVPEDRQTWINTQGEEAQNWSR